nr:unnamed protein product [Callosobruchus chinensis]
MVQLPEDASTIGNQFFLLLILQFHQHPLLCISPVMLHTPCFSSLGLGSPRI